MNILVPFEQLQSIVHIADIHIRLFRRHDEYVQAFDRLYADIREKEALGLKDYIIILAGDIVHAKTDMSPEMVEITSKFLGKIADFAPTILIAGNHDCNLANANRLDSLTPIVNNLQHPNLYYAKHSGIITIADTDIAVLSIFDEMTAWPTVSACSKPNKIALYHGPVHGATTDANFTITNRHVHVDTFNGYDMVLLGDIHKHQMLQERNESTAKPIIVYPSSLIQQNHGETIDGHGWCLWNVLARSVEFVPLHNDFGYATVEVKDGKLEYPKNIPNNVRMRLFTGDSSNTQIKKIVTTLRKKYNIIELSVNKSRFGKNLSRTTNTQDVVDLTDLSTQNSLINDWLQRNFPLLTVGVLTAIEKINKDLNNTIQHDDQSRNIHWRPLNFKFSNMFSYGENNEIDFTDMKGLYGIFAANASGKSSIMDSLMFCLYDKTPRAFKGDHIINNRKDTFECELSFEINNEVYGIKRNGARKKNGDVKVDAQFWKILDTGEKVSLNGEDRRDTNANIRNYVGSYEDFVMTALSSQTGNALFIDKSHSERKDLLIQFMGLNIFDKLYNAANDAAKEITGVLKRFKKAEVTDEISSTHTQLVVSRDLLDAREETYANLKESRETLDDILVSTQGLKRPVPSTSGNLKELQGALKKAQDTLATAQENVWIAESSLVGAKNDLRDSLDVFNQYDMTHLQESITHYNRLNELLIKGNGALRLVITKIEEKEKFKSTLLAYKYNPACEVCVENNASVIADLGTTDVELAELVAKKQLQQSSIAEIIKQLEPLTVDKNLYDAGTAAYQESQQNDQEVQRVAMILESAKVALEKAELNITYIKADLDIYTANEEAILYNQTIDADLAIIQEKIATNKRETTALEQELRTLHGTITVMESKKQELVDRLKEAEELELIYEAYNHYLLATSRDGVPYEMMSKAIPQIEAEINQILSQIVDFTISLEVDGKNINGKLTYDYDRIWPLENSSGMERFVSSLAIRVALMNASNLPKSNFLILDEGFGTLDAEHVHAMQTLFSMLKTHFDFILIVSHLDSMRDMVDTLLEIKKEDGYSSISV